jgi:hypothetical protein
VTRRRTHKESEVNKTSLSLVLVVSAYAITGLVSCGGSASKVADASGKTAQSQPPAERRYAMRNAEILTIRNPNASQYTGSPRDPAQVEAEMKLGCDLALLIEDYLRQNGLRKTVDELNKGRAGELGRYMLTTHFYLSFSVNMGERMHWKIIAHSTMPALVGYDIPDFSMVKDNTGWAYNTEMLKALEANPQKIGLVENLIWNDPEWSANSCRMDAYTNVFAYEGSSYHFYYAVWLDK